MNLQGANFANFFTYLALSLPLLVLGAYIFILSTPYKELHLIKEGSQDQAKSLAAKAAAYDLGGKILGQSIVLASAIYHAINPADLIIWGILGMAFQVIVFYLFEFLTPFKVTDEIAKGNVAVGILSSRISFATGLLLAAVISY
ncbi:DUF350 domain-containing protein [Acetonema longum]|uniref:DUF350 domain-containing protein n=1 Tax=Acetonema longum DSM 6540 TaxID=1009370 RepID=F7NMC2_9FIRM|nr:DUF350 domain-containing protein [Acetonema longum]EGO62798.1 hypothetical protein ALO_16302 [Acetonema longum DSM 6540]